jgi:putative heme-binding domain-containing protein
VVVLALLGPAASAQAPEQAERGKKGFAERRCGNCHRFEGQGTAAGPDLAAIAPVSPRALAIAILATRTAQVTSVKLKSGETFPAMRAGKDDKTVRFYDVSKDPPVLRTVTPAEIDSTKDNDTWRHPPSATTMPDTQLADVIAYLRWIAVRDRKPVAPEDLK